MGNGIEDPGPQVTELKIKIYLSVVVGLLITLCVLCSSGAFIAARAIPSHTTEANHDNN